MAYVKRGLKCTAHKKDGRPCGQWARAGYRVCRVHGAGKRASPGGRPITTGRYSRLHHQRIREIYHAYKNDPNPLDLMDELAMLRALVEDYIDRYDQFVEALLAWHASFGPPGLALTGDVALLAVAPQVEKPRQILDIADAARILSDIGRMVERIEALRNGAAVTQAEVAMILRKMAAAVEAHVPDVQIRQQIQAAWDAIDYT